MTNRDAVDFVYSGPETIAGKYLRRFWQPVYESAKLPLGRAVPIQVMNESFTLYRGEDGQAYVVAGRCPHRGAQLSIGWVEGDSIRCFYHGWKFGARGRCVEQPAEPKPFCQKINIASYPTLEQLGLVFAYLGDGPAPPLPRWPEFETQHAISTIAMLPCNYFQSAENIVDDVHVGFVHASTSDPGRTARERRPPLVSAEEAGHGIKMTYTKPDRIEHSYFMMPNSHLVNYYLDYVVPTAAKDQARMRTLFWYVPIDDSSHNHVMITTGPAEIIDLMRYDHETPHSVAEDIMAVLSGKEEWHKNTSRANRRPDMVRVQDGVSIVGQGPIVDRSMDRLGASDAGVVLLRKLWMRELRKLAAGDQLTPFARPVVLPH